MPDAAQPLTAQQLQSELLQIQQHHRELDERLEGFNGRPYLTNAEQAERTTLKKMKLRAKDRMSQIHRMIEHIQTS